MAKTTTSGTGPGRWFANRSVGAKFLMVIGVVVLAAAGVGLAGLLGMAALQRSSSQLYQNNLVPTTNLGQARVAALAMRSDVLNAGLSVNPVMIKKFAGKMAADDTTFDKYFNAYAATAPADRAAAIADAADGMRMYRQVRDTQLLPAAFARDLAAFDKARDTAGLAASNKVVNSLDALIKVEIASAQAKNANNQRIYTDARFRMVAFLIGGVLAGVAFGLFIARLVTGPVRKVATVLAAVAEGDLTRSADVTSTDELGRMAATLDTACSRLREMIGAVGANSHVLAGAAEELAGTSEHLAVGAEETSAQATTVSAAAGRVSDNIQNVSSASEEMNASIRDIARSSAEEAGVVQRAMTATETATETVSQLGTSSVEIGNVVKTITAIAEQTNLLALNATIEAARAGEAGRGFAVVAGEVKDLAQETSRATDDITRRIAAIQSDAEAAVDVIGEITAVIRHISEYSTAIAAAVEEQTATTGEIGRNVTQAAAGSTEIAQNIAGVATAVRASTAAIDETRRSVADLARMSTELQRLVDQFRY